MRKKDILLPFKKENYIYFCIIRLVWHIQYNTFKKGCQDTLTTKKEGVHKM